MDIFSAVRKGHLESLEKLIRDGVDVNEENVSGKVSPMCFGNCACAER